MKADGQPPELEVLKLAQAPEHAQKKTNDQGKAEQVLQPVSERPSA
jgi:hypothetical protein